MASASGGQLQPRSNLLPEMICRNHDLYLTKSARERQLDGVKLQRLPTMIGTLGFATIEGRQVLDTAKFDLAGDLRADLNIASSNRHSESRPYTINTSSPDIR
jgi:hypothetical protein